MNASLYLSTFFAGSLATLRLGLEEIVPWPGKRTCLNCSLMTCLRWKPCSKCRARSQVDPQSQSQHCANRLNECGLDDLEFLYQSQMSLPTTGHGQLRYIRFVLQLDSAFFSDFGTGQRLLNNRFDVQVATKFVKGLRCQGGFKAKYKAKGLIYMGLESIE